MVIDNADNGFSEQLNPGCTVSWSCMKGSMLFGLCLLFISTISWSAGLGIRAYSDPKPAPDFTLSDLSGRLHQSSDYRGRAYIISFWATWCVPCIRELPDLQRAAEILENDGIVVLTANSSESREVIEQFMATHPVNLPVLLDQGSNMLRQWRVLALPTAYLVNTEGRIVARVVGGIEWAEASILRHVQSLISTIQSIEVRSESTNDL